LKEWHRFALMVIAFVAAYLIPFGTARVDGAVLEEDGAAGRRPACPNPP